MSSSRTFARLRRPRTQRRDAGAGAAHEGASRRGRCGAAATPAPAPQGHQVDHVKRIGWAGKKDKFVFADAVTHGYDILVTKNVNQLADPDECSALKRAGIHHAVYDQGDGLEGLGRAMGAILAAMPGIVRFLDGRQEQALMRVHGIAGQRFTETDPATIPYWPR